MPHLTEKRNLVAEYQGSEYKPTKTIASIDRPSGSVDYPIAASWHNAKVQEEATRLKKLAKAVADAGEKSAKAEAATNSIDFLGATSASEAHSLCEAALAARIELLKKYLIYCQQAAGFAQFQIAESREAYDTRITAKENVIARRSKFYLDSRPKGRQDDDLPENSMFLKSALHGDPEVIFHKAAAEDAFTLSQPNAYSYQTFHSNIEGIATELKSIRERMLAACGL